MSWDPSRSFQRLLLTQVALILVYPLLGESTSIKFLLGAFLVLALYGGVKLPSGDEDKLTGSGATDYSFGLGYTDPLLLAGIRTVISAHAGVLMLGDGNVLEEDQKNTVGFGGVQLAFSATKRLTLLAQIQGASSYYDSDLDVLGGNTVQLSFGANLRWPESGWDWRFGIVEDGLSKVMPDFALHMEISRRFGGR